MTRNYLAIALLTLAATTASAGLISNGGFEDTGGFNASFSINNPTVLPGWSATPSGNKILNCLMFSGTTANLCGSVAFGGGFSFWSHPGASPDGGNFVGIDGDPAYATPLTQTISGLIAGHTYNLTFYQASAQQSGFDGATTERWRVSLGGSASQLSTLMNTATHGSTPWTKQSMNFTAGATKVLSFLAVGTPSGVPPFVLLDGVALTDTTVPEPGTFALFGAGALAVLAVRKRR